LANQSKECDVAVIGAGILGLSIAYHLKKHSPNKDILVLDRFGAVAQGNTARSNAMFRNTFTSWDNQMLANSSVDFYLDTQSSGVDLGLKKSGYLWMMSERQLSLNEKHIDAMNENGIELRRYEKNELERAIPDLQATPSDEEAKLMKLESVAAGFYGVKCGRLDPDKLARFYSQQFLSLGGKIVFNTNAKSLIVEPDEPFGIEGEPFVWQESSVRGANVEGEINGEVRAKDALMVAAGVWNNELLEPIGVDGHVKAKKRQLFKISAKENENLSKFMRNKKFNELGELPFVILPKYGCYLVSATENNEFRIGCEDELNRAFVNIPDRSMDDCRAEPRYYEQNIYPILKEYFPIFQNSKPSQSWAGTYSYNTLDSIPFVFSESGMIVAGGGSGSGIIKADAMGRLVDAVYRLGEDSEATLYGGASYPVSKIGFKNRSVQREEWVI
jgi:FAD-dependent oxidoreductase domain-containing protein 1